MTEPLTSKPNWRESQYAQQYFACECPFLGLGMKQAIGPSVLQIGGYLEQSLINDLDLPFLVRSGGDEHESLDIVSDPAFLPFDEASFSTVVLPHILEGHELPHQVLREAHRVLMSEGHIVITGFNPLSMMGLQRIVRPKAVCSGRYYTVRRVIDWLQLLGFEVVTTSMFQYSPLFRSPRFRSAFHFLEAVGSRWLPMTGGGYMISAKKRQASGTLVGKLRFKRLKPKLVGSAASVKVDANGSRKNL